MPRKPKARIGAWILAAAMGLGTAGSATAEAPAASATAEPVVVQISEGGAFQRKLVLNNVANLLRSAPEGQRRVEVVAYGPGIRLLGRGSKHHARVEALMDKGVDFLACANTLAAMGKEMGDLVPGVKKIPSGVARIVQRQGQGWAYLRP
jgi:hypothetical protein